MSIEYQEYQRRLRGQYPVGSPYFPQRTAQEIWALDGFGDLSKSQKRTLLRYGQAVANFFGLTTDIRLNSNPQKRYAHIASHLAMLKRERYVDLIEGVPQRLISEVRNLAVSSLREIPKLGFNPQVGP